MFNILFTFYLSSSLIIIKLNKSFRYSFKELFKSSRNKFKTNFK